MAKPLHIQRLEKALDLGPFMKYAESILSKNDEIQSESDDESGIRRHTFRDKELMFNADNIGEDRKWLLNLLLSDTESDSEISDVDKYMSEMLKEHKREKKLREKYHSNPSVSNFKINFRFKFANVFDL
jgi:chromatin-remodeling ATPase INO80